MKTYIALFRGINVGGNTVLPMKNLVAVLEKLGARNIKTYIQSGNAVFKIKGKNPSQISSEVRSEIKRRCGFEPHVLLLTLAELQKAIAGNPFPEAESDPKALHVAFLASVPANPNLRALGDIKTESERFLLKGKVFYLHAPDGIGRSKLAASAEKLLGVSLTDRNWRTVSKIRDMAKRDNKIR
jgi:uncharacterized protein (DUF1697 family)